MKAQASELAGWLNRHERLRAGLPSPPREAPPPLPASGASRSNDAALNSNVHANNGQHARPHLPLLDTTSSSTLPLDPALEQFTFSRTVFPPPQPPTASLSDKAAPAKVINKAGGKGRGRGQEAVPSPAALQSAGPPAKKQKTAAKPRAKKAGTEEGKTEQVKQTSSAPSASSQRLLPESIDNLPPHMQPMPSGVSRPMTNGHGVAVPSAVDTFSQPQASTIAASAPSMNGSDRQIMAHDESADPAPSAKKRRTSGNGTAVTGAIRPTSAAAGRRRSSASTSASAAKRPSPPVKQAATSGILPSPHVGASGSTSASAVDVDTASGPSSLPPIPPEALDAGQGVSSVASAPPMPSPAASQQSQLPKVVLTEEQKRANHIASEQKRRTAIRSAYDELCGVVPSLRAAVQEYEERLTRVHGAHAAAAAAAGRRGSAARLVDGTPGTAGAEIETVAGVLTGGIDVGGEKVDGRAGPKSEAVVLGKSAFCPSLSQPSWISD